MKSKTTVVVRNCLIVFLLLVVGLLAVVPTEQQVYASTERIDLSRPVLLQADPPNTHPIMRITAKQKRAEAELTKGMPAAPIDRAMQRTLLGRTEGAALSLLSHIQYTPAERSQGSAGNCWVWAGTGVLEVALDVQQSIKDRLSIQYLDSNYTPWAGCGGTAQNFRSFYASKLKVIPWSNTNASYQDSGRSCGSGGSLVAPGSIGQTPSYAITSIGPVQLIPTYGVGQATAIANIKNILDQNKAVYFSFYLANDTDWDEFFSFWSNQAESVIWNGEHGGFSCGEVYNSDGNGGAHAVVCVGYDDSAAGTDNDYWIMLNSWGRTDDRPNGLFRIPMYYDYDCADSTGDPNTAWRSIPVTFTPTAPTITNASGATDITATTATLNGSLTSDGGSATTVTIYYGPTDGGTTIGNWVSQADLGTRSAGAFSAGVTGLTTGTTYYYRCYASNSTGTSWASSSSSFVPAASPVRLLGPVDATSGTHAGGYAVWDQWAASSTGNITQLRVKANASGNVKVALYADNAGNPGTLLQAINTSTPVVAGWNTINIPTTAVTSGTNYWLAISSDTSCFAYQSGASISRRYISVTLSSFSFTDSPSGLINSTGAYEGITGWGNTQPPTPPSAPSLLEPGASITFQWGTSTGASKYQLQVNTTQAFDGTSMFDADIGNNTIQAVPGLSLCTTYYWRVKAGNSGGWGAWAPTRSVLVDQLP